MTKETTENISDINNRIIPTPMLKYTVSKKYREFVIYKAHVNDSLEIFSL